jgi:hypothetical protein
MLKSKKLAEREAVVPSIRETRYSRDHTNERPRTIPRNSIDFVTSLANNKRHKIEARE